MLACVCQPSDTGIFRRSPVPLGAPPLKINRGAIPKPGRTLRLSSLPVITSEPSAKNKHQTCPTSGNEGTVNRQPPASSPAKGKKNKGAERCQVSNGLKLEGDGEMEKCNKVKDEDVGGSMLTVTKKVGWISCVLQILVLRINVFFSIMNT